MTFDPYTNRIPHGLLTDDERAALEATGGPWEVWGWSGWVPVALPTWSKDVAYRAVRKFLPVPQDGDVWVSPTGQWYANGADDNEDENISVGWRLFREVKA
jgi:hypothetical protein